jgi:[protein-PII] uridylyltransferase
MPPQAHLERVLSRAERELVRDAHRKPADVLDLYRRFFKRESYALKVLHRQGESGKSLAEKRADLMSVVLRHIFEGAWENALRSHVTEAAPRLSLLAVGGFGRAELCPCSDIDILFLYAHSSSKCPPIVEDIVQQVLYMLWDIGFKVGPATRTMSELIHQCNEDLQTKTSLLEARFLCGDDLLFQEYERSFAAVCLRGREEEYLSWRMQDQITRHEKHGNTVFLQEPNVKNGCGGLRDLHNLLWISRIKHGITSVEGLQNAGFVNPIERKSLEQAYDFLLRIRNELHFLQDRCGDILTLYFQGRVANNLRYQHHTQLRRIEGLMRDYYEHARQLFLLTESLSRRVAGLPQVEAKTKWSFLPKGTVRTERLDGFILRNGVLECENGMIFNDDPMRLLRVFVTAQQRGAQIGPELGFRIRRRIRLIDRTFIYHKATRAMLLTMFSRKGQVGNACRAMHEHGVLGRVFPEFRPLTCLVQHEFFHRYTADEHTLQCIEMLDRIIDASEPPFEKYRPLLQEVERPHVLYLAMLLHDTGRAESVKRHSDASATNAVRVARRLKLDPTDLATLVFLVDHHLTMSDTARRRNLEEDDSILEFARIVQTGERLDMLMLLTFADYQGTGSLESRSDWKDLLLWRLYERTHECLKNKEEFLQAAEQSLGELRDRVSKALAGQVNEEEINAHFEHLPSRYFRNLPEDEIIRHIRCVHDFFWSQIMADDNALRPAILWDNREDQGHSEVTLVTWNRDRGFAKITGAFASCGLSILSAEVFTRHDDIVICTFRVATERLEAASDHRDKVAFEKILMSALTQENFQFGAEMSRKGRNPLKLDDPDFPTLVGLDQRSSRDYTVLDLQAPDRPGLLYRVASFLAEQGIEVANARITTEKGAALDTLYLCDRNGMKLSRDMIRHDFARRLQKAIDA